MASVAAAAAARQPGRDPSRRRVKSWFDDKIVEPSRFKRPEPKPVDSAASVSGLNGETTTKTFNFDDIERKARKAKGNGIFQRPLNQLQQQEITKSLAKRKAEKVSTPVRNTKALPEEHAEEGDGNSPEWKTLYEENFFAIRTPKKEYLRERHNEKRRERRRLKRGMGELPRRSSLIVKLRLPRDLQNGSNSPQSVTSAIARQPPRNHHSPAAENDADSSISRVTNEEQPACQATQQDPIEGSLPSKVTKLGLSSNSFAELASETFEDNARQNKGDDDRTKRLDYQAQEERTPSSKVAFPDDTVRTEIAALQASPVQKTPFTDRLKTAHLRNTTPTPTTISSQSASPHQSHTNGVDSQDRAPADSSMRLAKEDDQFLVLQDPVFADLESLVADDLLQDTVENAHKVSRSLNRKPTPAIEEQGVRPRPPPSLDIPRLDSRPPTPSPSISQGSPSRIQRKPSSASSHESKSSSHMATNRPTAMKNGLGVPVDADPTRQAARFEIPQAPQAPGAGMPPPPDSTTSQRAFMPMRGPPPSTTPSTTPSIASTNAILQPLPQAMVPVVNVFPEDVKGLPTLKILGTTDPSDELLKDKKTENLYGKKFHCQWRVIATYNAREALGPNWMGKQEWDKWENDHKKWIKDDVTVMKALGETSHDKDSGHSCNHCSLPVELFRDPKPNDDGSYKYSIPQRFQIQVEIEPLIPRYAPLGLDRPSKLSKTAKDKIQKEGAAVSQVRLLAKIEYHKDGPRIVECDIKTYLADNAKLLPTLTPEKEAFERMKQRVKAIRETEHTTPFKLAMEIEWPTWCKEPVREASSKDDHEDDEAVTIQQDAKSGDGAIQVPGDVPEQPLMDSLTSLPAIVLVPTQPLSEGAIAQASGMSSVDVRRLQTSRLSSATPDPVSATKQEGSKADDKAHPPPTPAPGAQPLELSIAVRYGIVQQPSNADGPQHGTLTSKAALSSAPAKALPQHGDNVAPKSVTDDAPIDLTQETNATIQGPSNGATKPAGSIKIEDSGDGTTGPRPRMTEGAKIPPGVPRRVGSDPTGKHLGRQSVKNPADLPSRSNDLLKLGEDKSSYDTQPMLLESPFTASPVGSSPVKKQSAGIPRKNPSDAVSRMGQPAARTASEASTVSANEVVPNPANSRASPMSPAKHGHPRPKLYAVTSATHEPCIWVFAGAPSLRPGGESADKKTVDMNSRCLICREPFDNFQGLRAHLKDESMHDKRRITLSRKGRDGYRIEVSLPQATGNAPLFMETADGRTTTASEDANRPEGDDIAPRTGVSMPMLEAAVRRAPADVARPASIVPSTNLKSRAPNPFLAIFARDPALAASQTMDPRMAARTKPGRPVTPTLKGSRSSTKKTTPAKAALPTSVEKQKSSTTTPLASASSRLSSDISDGRSDEKLTSAPPERRREHTSTPRLPTSTPLTTGTQATGGPSAASTESRKESPASITCHWQLVDENDRRVPKKRRDPGCHICNLKFENFQGLRDHLASPRNHADRSIRIAYDKPGKACDIWVRLPLAGKSPLKKKLFAEVQDSAESQNAWRWLRRADEPSPSIPSTPLTAPAPQFSLPSPPPPKEATKATTYLPQTPAPTTLQHKRCTWSVIWWDKARVEEQDETSRCILCNENFQRFGQLLFHLEKDGIHGKESITIAYNANFTDCRILVDQTNWKNLEQQDQIIREVVFADGKRNMSRRSVDANGTLSIDEGTAADRRRAPPAHLMCQWITADDEYKEDNNSHCVSCGKTFATFADLRWHLAESTGSDHQGCQIKIAYGFDGDRCQITVSKAVNPPDTESYRHSFVEVFPDGPDMWESITTAQPDTYEKLSRHEDTSFLRSATLQMPQFKVKNASCTWKFWPYVWGEDAPEEENDSGKCLICLKECGSFKGLRDHLMYDNAWHRWCITILYGDDPNKVEICLENMETLGLFFERRSERVGLVAAQVPASEAPTPLSPTQLPFSRLPSARKESKEKLVYWDIPDYLRAKFSRTKIYDTYMRIACNNDTFSTWEELQTHLTKDKEHEGHNAFPGERRHGSKYSVLLKKKPSMPSPEKSKAENVIPAAANIPAVEDSLPISSPRPPSPSSTRGPVAPDQAAEAVAALSARDAASPSQHRATTTLPDQMNTQATSENRPISIHHAGEIVKAADDSLTTSRTADAVPKPLVSCTAHKENANPRRRSGGESADVEVVADSTQLDRAPLSERVNNQQGSSGNRVPEAPPSRPLTPMEVAAPSEVDDETPPMQPVPPDYLRSSPLPSANAARPMDWNMNTVHDPVTRLPIGPGGTVPQYLQDNSSTTQAHIDLTHRSKQLSDDDTDFMVVWDSYILAKPGRGSSNEYMPKTIKQFVCANWDWLHQRPSRVPCYLKQVAALKAVDRITPQAAREAAMLLRPPPVPVDAWNRVDRDCSWTGEILEQNRKNWTALWDSLVWQQERSSDSFTAAMRRTFEQFVNVAGHLLLERGQLVLETRARSILSRMVNHPNDLIGEMKYGDMAALDTVQALHESVIKGTKESHPRLEAYLHAKQKAFESVIVLEPGADETEERMKRLLKEENKKFTKHWRWRRYHEAELHMLFLSGQLRLHGWIQQLGNIAWMGGTTDPEAPPDSYPPVVEPPILKPASLPNVPPEGKLLPIQKPVEVRGMMECKCGFDVVPWNVVYCANRHSRKRKCPHPTYHRLCADAPSAARKVGRLREEDWFCEECRKRGWDRAESPDDGGGGDEPDDDGDARGAPPSAAPRDNSARDNTRRGTEDGQRNKSPNPQPRKKPRTTREDEADTPRTQILAHDVNSTFATSQAPTNLPGVPVDAPPKEQQVPAPTQSKSSNPKRPPRDSFGSATQQKRPRLDGSISGANDMNTVASPIGTIQSTPTTESTDFSASQIAPSSPPSVTEDSASIMSPGSGADSESPGISRSQSRSASTIKKDGGPCRKCNVTQSRAWLYKLNMEARPGDGKVWCRNCYASDSKKKITARKKSMAKGQDLGGATPAAKHAQVKKRDKVKAQLDAARLKYHDLEDEEADSEALGTQKRIIEELKKMHKQLQAEVNAAMAEEDKEGV